MTGAVGPPAIPRLLVVTGHFPPERGGVQTFTWEIVRRLPPEQLVIVAPAQRGAADFDAALAFPVERRHAYLLFAGVRALVRRYRIEAAWITAMAPFGLYAPLLRAAGVPRVIASTHGQELGWIRAWPTRSALRGAARTLDGLTYLSDTTFAALRSAGVRARRHEQLSGGVDPARFEPSGDRLATRRALGLGDGPLVLSVSRLVRRKGQDVLLQAWPSITAVEPSAQLVVVGDGPMRARLADRARAAGLSGVRFTGWVDDERLAGLYGSADVFVLPCRDDRRGLQTEGLGLTTLEASAAGVPVVVGRSGGSVDSVRPGETGVLVDPTDAAAVAAAVTALLTDRERAIRMGTAGRDWVRGAFTWEVATQRLAGLLCDVAGG